MPFRPYLLSLFFSPKFTGIFSAFLDGLENYYFLVIFDVENLVLSHKRSYNLTLLMYLVKYYEDNRRKQPQNLD